MKHFLSLLLWMAVYGNLWTPIMADPRIDCQDKMNGFFECVNTTIRERHGPSSKLQFMKIRVNECLQKNQCVKMYIDVIPDDSQTGDHWRNGSKRIANMNIMQCLRDFRDQAIPRLETCVYQLVPDLAYVEHPKEFKENKWTLIQQAMNKTRLQQLCQINGNANEASACIDRLFTPNARIRRVQEKRFKEFCTAARRCQIGMGLCRTQLDNGRKALCDCAARMIEDFDIVRSDLASCQDVTMDDMRAFKKFSLPFLDDCGPDPCDQSFDSLTRGRDENEDDESLEITDRLSKHG